MKSLSAILFVAVCLTLSSAVATGSPVTSPLRIHPTNSRYFTDGSGKAVYLTGSHTWANLQDSGLQVGTSIPTDPPPVFDYTAYLDLLQANNHNFIRLWRQENPKATANGTSYAQPHPWVRSGPGMALDGKPKFDLSQFDQSYFDRLRSRVIAARDRGIYASVMLFEGWYLLNASASWQYNAFNGSNNINGINGDLNADGKGYETNTLQSPAVLALQKAYINKVIDTVNDLDNVLYEIANESGVSGSAEWQYDLTNYINAYQAGKPKQHPVGMTDLTSANHNNVLWNSPANWISLGQITHFDNSADPYASNPPAAPGGKVSILDTDHLGWDIYVNNPTFSRAWVWKSFVRGHNPILMEDLKNNSGWIAARAAMGHTHTYADTMDLAAMTPQADAASGPSSTGYCLSKTGATPEYMAYLSSGSSLTMNLSGAAGVLLSAEWFNTDTGVAYQGANVSGGGSSVALTAPSSGAWALYLTPLKLAWTGVGGTTWSTAGGLNNWKKTYNGATGDYGNPATVIFDDTATGTAAGISAADVSPAGVTFNNSGKNFTISGSKGIAGAATVTKQGYGTVTMSSVNNYSGRTTVEGGKLVLVGRNKSMKPVLDNGGADIKGGMLVLDYLGETDPAETINALITTSYHAAGANHFDIGQFRSSTADAVHGLGWTDNPWTKKINVAYTIYGDADLDGTVGLADLGKVLTNWGVGNKWGDGDVDYNAAVGLSDLGKVLTNWGLSVGTLTPAAVPEPSPLAMLAALASLVGAWAIRRK